MVEREQRLREQAREAGQEHLFEDWSALDAGAREGLLDQLEALDFAQLPALRALLDQGGEGGEAPRLEAPDVFPLERDAAQAEQAEAARRRGCEELAAGRVGYVLVAGGQASRLGYDGPKGAFSIGPVSGRSLFEIHARRLRAAAQRYGVADALVRDDLARPTTRPRAPSSTSTTWFGLARARTSSSSARRCCRPSTNEGRLLLRRPPIGCSWPPTATAAHWRRCRARRAPSRTPDAGACTQLSYWQVDNPLVPPADPLFLGLHDAAGAGMSEQGGREARRG